jgi:hypothetical protein
MTKEEALKKIEELKNYINSCDNESNKVKSDNLIIERDLWFLSILKDLKVGNIESYYIVYSNSKNEWMFQDVKNGILWCSYGRIWSILESKYNMEYTDIQSYIGDQVLNHLNWKVTTPYLPEHNRRPLVLNHLNWKVTTPNGTPITLGGRVLNHLNWKVTTPSSNDSPCSSGVLNHLNWKVTTPITVASISDKEVLNHLNWKVTTPGKTFISWEWGC